MKIGVFGAGSIGCYLGGMLAAAGDRPVVIGRASMMKRLAAGMTLTHHDGTKRNAAPETFEFCSSPDPIADCDAVLVCVKSSATREAAVLLAPLLREGAMVVSLQNGVSNSKALRETISRNPVFAAMVGFNVAQVGTERFHCATEGQIVLEMDSRTAQLAQVLTAAGVPAATSENIEAVQWGKLILNLNNAVNALSGLPLKRQLAQRAYRRVGATAVREALAVMKAAGIKPARIVRAPPWLLPLILDLPDALFAPIADGVARVDENARTSMAEDLERGRMPEIDWLNGEIVSLGRTVNVNTPVNERLVLLVKAAFAEKKSPQMSGKELLKETGLA